MSLFLFDAEHNVEKDSETNKPKSVLDEYKIHVKMQTSIKPHVVPTICATIEVHLFHIVWKSAGSNQTEQKVREKGNGLKKFSNTFEIVRTCNSEWQETQT